MIPVIWCWSNTPMQIGKRDQDVYHQIYILSLRKSDQLVIKVLTNCETLNNRDQIYRTHPCNQTGHVALSLTKGARIWTVICYYAIWEQPVLYLTGQKFYTPCLHKAYWCATPLHLQESQSQRNWYSIQAESGYIDRCICIHQTALMFAILKLVSKKGLYSWNISMCTMNNHTHTKHCENFFSSFIEVFLFYILAYIQHYQGFFFC